MEPIVNYDDIMKRLKMVFEKNGVKEGELLPAIEQGASGLSIICTS